MSDVIKPVVETAKEAVINQDIGQSLPNEELQENVEKFRKLKSNYDKLYDDQKKLVAELERERKNKMTAKEQEEFEKSEYEKKLLQKEQELNGERLKFEKTKALSLSSYDPDFLDIVTGDNIDVFNENVKKLNDKLKKIIEKEVNERLAKGNPIPATGTAEQQTYTMDELKKMTKDEISKNYDKVMKSYAANTNK